MFQYLFWKCFKNGSKSRLWFYNNVFHFWTRYWCLTHTALSCTFLQWHILLSSGQHHSFCFYLIAFTVSTVDFCTDRKDCKVMAQVKNDWRREETEWRSPPDWTLTKGQMKEKFWSEKHDRQRKERKTQIRVEDGSVCWQREPEGFSCFTVTHI